MRSWLPQADADVRRCMLEIAITTEKSKSVTDTQLSEESIDRPELHSCSATGQTHSRCSDVVVAIRCDERHTRKSFDEAQPRGGRHESLQQFLNDETRGDDQVIAGQCPTQFLDVGRIDRGVSSQCQRPHAGVDKNGHSRERSAL